MKPKAIIFDFFDVLHADPFQAWMRTHGLTRQGKQAEASRLLDLNQISIAEFFSRLAEVSGQTQDEVADEFEAAMALDESAVAIVRELRPNYKTALLSNAHGDELRPVLSKHDLAELFDVVAISGEVGHAKPSAEIFHHVLAELGVSPEETLFIDDNAENIQAAERLGIVGIVHTDAQSLRQQLVKLGVLL
jgi:HAD superfamily hydrolase (TIGR01509 family)